jgi:hypothetical protein
MNHHLALKKPDNDTCRNHMSFFLMDPTETVLGAQKKARASSQICYGISIWFLYFSFDKFSLVFNSSNL